ncbi:hypothetical protein T484DRAFT_1809088, partial [Baffinella frigidus]
RVETLRLKREDELRELHGEGEVEYFARREYNNALIELRRVEELEPQLIADEKAAMEEGKIIAEMRATQETKSAVRFEKLVRAREQETKSALRFEKLVRAREQVAVEQHALDQEKTLEFAERAKVGRVAAIKRVKESRERRQESEQSRERRQESEQPRTPPGE